MAIKQVSKLHCFISIAISELWNSTIQLLRINEHYQMVAGDDPISMSDMTYALFNDN